MPQKAVITEESEFDALGEDRQADYKQAQDGKSWILELEGVDDHPTVSGMKTTIRKFKELAPSAKTLKKTLDDFETLRLAWEGLDPEETKVELARLAELDGGEKVDVEARITAAKASLEKKHTKQLKDKQEELEASEGRVTDRDKIIETKTVETEIEAGLTHVGVLPEYRKAAKAVIRMDHKPTVERVENEETGKVSYRGIIKTEAGEVSIPDFFERWATEEDAQGFLPPSGNVGTDSKTRDAKLRGRKTNPWDPKHWNVTEQGRILEENRGAAKTMAAAFDHEIAEA